MVPCIELPSGIAATAAERKPRTQLGSGKLQANDWLVAQTNILSCSVGERIRGVSSSSTYAVDKASPSLRCCIQPNYLVSTALEQSIGRAEKSPSTRGESTADSAGVSFAAARVRRAAPAVRPRTASSSVESHRVALRVLQPRPSCRAGLKQSRRANDHRIPSDSNLCCLGRVLDMFRTCSAGPQKPITSKAGRTGERCIVAP